MLRVKEEHCILAGVLTPNYIRHATNLKYYNI